MLLLKSRLYNVVFIIFIAPTIADARLFITHNHVTVNCIVVNVPSYTVKANDIIGVKEKSKSLEAITNSLSSARFNKYSWLEWDNDQMVGKFLNVPERSDIPENIKEQLIVELYSK
mgnify:CR=1 FL=1